MTLPLIVATGNPGKVREFAEFFRHCEETSGVWELQPKPADLEISETGDTFEANAIQKAQGVALALEQWAIADDSGLVVDALDGAPGIHSARYAPSNEERIARVLRELVGQSDRRAAFVCAIALCRPDGSVAAVAQGRCIGEILTEPRGSGGFGYDPIFYVPLSGLTFAEMPARQKEQIGHRGQALRSLRTQLSQLNLLNSDFQG